MFVNIGYTVKFEDVPRVIKKMIYEDISLLANDGIVVAIADSVEQLEGDNIGKAIQSIDEVRKNLILIDAQLSNCYDILSGYQQEKLGLTKKENSVSGPAESPGDLSVLKNQLLNLQKEIEDTADLGERQNEDR
tara:strand:+ start:192 stop:593 length:402 start_codon:yes stop_codon:yes gene_type:complete